MIHELLNNSFFSDEFLLEKFFKEFTLESKHDYSNVFTTVKELCRLSREQGFKSMYTMYESVDNMLIKNILFLVYEMTNVNTDVDYVFYLLKPALYHSNNRGAEFVEAMLYSEAILMILSGEVFELIYVRLSCLIGERILLKDNIK